MYRKFASHRDLLYLCVLEVYSLISDTVGAQTKQHRQSINEMAGKNRSIRRTNSSFANFPTANGYQQNILTCITPILESRELWSLVFPVLQKLPSRRRI
jgi:hypothetical protein